MGHFEGFFKGATIRHPPYLPDLGPADFFLFPRVKSELEGLNDLEELPEELGGVIQTVPKDNFAAAFRRWMERSEKRVHIGKDYVKK
jgi:hypothetical protein